MTILDPPWKQKTRPCPFYSQGRCLFADSCNFLHDVKVKVKIPQPSHEDVHLFSSLSPTPPNVHFPTSPVVQISSPTSPSAASLRSSIRSPTRSPRLSSLLLALGDVIDTDEDEDASETEYPTVTSPVSLDMPAESSRHGKEEAVDASLPGSGVDHSTPSDVVSQTVPLKAHAEESEDMALTYTPSQIVTSAHIGEETANEDEVAGVTPLGSQEHALGQDNNPLPVHAGESVVDNENEDIVGVLPRGQDKSDQVHPESSSAASSPGKDNAAGSSIESRHTSPPPVAQAQGHLDNEYNREDSIDSGYADNWVGPSPFVLSPPRSPRRASTFSLLASPFGTPSSRVISSPTFVPNPTSGWPAPTIFSPPTKTDASPVHPHALSDDLDSPSEYHRLHDRVQSISDADPEATVKPPATPSLHDEGFDESMPFSPDTESIAPHPLTVNSHPSENDDPFDTAVTVDEDASPKDDEDECGIYDGYYMDSSPHVATSQHPSLSHSPSPKTSVTQPPILSPPEPKLTFSRSCTSSPLQISTFSASLPAGPFGATEPDSEPVRPHSAADVISFGKRWEARSSTKVPFGFRHSAQIRPNDTSSSIAPTRSVGTYPPPTRHRPPALTGLDTSPNRSSGVWKRDSSTLSPAQSTSSSKGLKPLRLSMILNSSSSIASPLASSGYPSLNTASSAFIPPSPTVSSDYSISNNGLLSSPRSSFIPSQHYHTPNLGPNLTHPDDAYNSMPHSAPIPSSRPTSWRKSQHLVDITHDSTPHSASSSRRSSLIHIRSSSLRPSSRLSEPLVPLDEDEEVVFIEQTDDHSPTEDHDDTIRGQLVSASVHSYSCPPSVLRSPVHAIATPKPTLLFAIASDDVNEVRRVLENGEASPNDDVGPQSALAFTLTANNLTHKMEMVKLLLAHGANPTSLKGNESSASSNSSLAQGAAVASPSLEKENTGSGRMTPSMTTVLESMDPATRYYIARAEAPQTRRASALIHRSFFRPLTKVRYDLIGQDRVLEQLFRVLGMPAVAPTVVLLCGPSGHGKSLLARKFGSLLDVPTHTVNMTTLRSTHDIWRSYSMSPYEPPSTCTLADFLMENEGKRCVVVLDEIEKIENDNILSSLLMPWELGRCSFEAGHRHVDVSKVIWLGTSNIGHDLVFQHQTSRETPEEALTREEYVDLMGILRPQVSERLGPSLLSRVTTVLPFVPFTTDEKMAISAEALYALAGENARSLPSATVEKLVQNSLQAYVPAEGARSLYRAVSTQLLDTIY